MEDLIYRILNRKILINVEGQDLIVLAPTSDLRQKAESYKQGIINDFKYDLPFLADYNLFLVKYRFIDADYETKIKNMTDAIKKLKVRLFQCGARVDQEKRVRKDLNTMKDKLSDYYSHIEYYRHQTLDYFAESAKTRYILINTIYSNNNLLFDENNLNVNLLNTVVGHLNKNDISTMKFRELARSDSWRMYWEANKYDIFGIPAKDFSEEQKILCMFSRMYQNIYENPDCPSDEIIADDDKIDGFLILQQEKNKDIKKEKNITTLDSKYSEVFVTAKSQDEANEVYNANTTEGQRLLKERAAVLTSKGETRDSSFRDVQLDILSQKSRNESKIMGMGGR